MSGNKMFFMTTPSLKLITLHTKRIKAKRKNLHCTPPIFILHIIELPFNNPEHTSAPHYTARRLRHHLAYSSRGPAAQVIDHDFAVEKVEKNAKHFQSLSMSVPKAVGDFIHHALDISALNSLVCPFLGTAAQ